MTEGLVEILIIAVICIVVFSIYIRVVIPFLKERDYIKSEIKRSITGSDYRHWKRELKRLYLLSVPFIGRFLVKLVRRKHK